MPEQRVAPSCWWARARDRCPETCEQDSTAPRGEIQLGDPSSVRDATGVTAERDGACAPRPIASRRSDHVRVGIA